MSRGLANAGSVELLARHLFERISGLRAHIAAMGILGAALSAVMNNVAALALLMPLDLKAAEQGKRSPALTLMPLSFATILGGMVTLIGTPPNIVVASIRADALGSPFRMFDFAPVGLVVAGAGIAFITLVGWRLIPAGRREHNATAELRELAGYVLETRAPEGSPTIGKRLLELQETADEHGVTLLGIVRRGVRLPGLARWERVEPDDLLVVQGGPEGVEGFMGALGLEHPNEGGEGITRLGEALELLEAVVPQGASIEGRSALELGLRYRFGASLIGIARRGERFRERVSRLRLQAGDLVLLLGPEGRTGEAARALGLLPLAPRGLQIVQREKAWTAIGIFTVAIALAALGLVYLPIALALVVLAWLGLGIVSPTQLYESVEWPIIVLLASLIPIGEALEASGGTALIARELLALTAGHPPFLILTVLMLVTMTLSDLLNNVATALIAAPIGLEIADRLGLSADPFLMAVAVAASCAFLTPIGHKNNILVMGPGGYRFGDYWRMGLPLEILVVALGVPAILAVWPFTASP